MQYLLSLKQYIRFQFLPTKYAVGSSYTICFTNDTHLLSSVHGVQLDWSDFSVALPETDIPRMHEVLQGVTQTERLGQYQVHSGPNLMKALCTHILPFQTISPG